MVAGSGTTVKIKSLPDVDNEAGKPQKNGRTNNSTQNYTRHLSLIIHRLPAYAPGNP